MSEYCGIWEVINSGRLLREGRMSAREKRGSKKSCHIAIITWQRDVSHSITVSAHAAHTAHSFVSNSVALLFSMQNKPDLTETTFWLCEWNIKSQSTIDELSSSERSAQHEIQWKFNEMTNCLQVHSFAMFIHHHHQRCRRCQWRLKSALNYEKIK